MALFVTHKQGVWGTVAYSMILTQSFVSYHHVCDESREVFHDLMQVTSRQTLKWNIGKIGE